MCCSDGTIQVQCEEFRESKSLCSPNPCENDGTCYIDQFRYVLANTVVVYFQMLVTFLVNFSMKCLPLVLKNNLKRGKDLETVKNAYIYTFLLQKLPLFPYFRQEV